MRPNSELAHSWVRLVHECQAYLNQGQVVDLVNTLDCLEDQLVQLRDYLKNQGE